MSCPRFQRQGTAEIKRRTPTYRDGGWKNSGSGISGFTVTKKRLLLSSLFYLNLLFDILNILRCSAAVIIFCTQDTSVCQTQECIDDIRRKLSS